MGIAGSADVFDVLTSLVDKSLLRVTSPPGTGEPRFGMLQTIRAFALEQLEQAGERATRMEASAAYFLRLAEKSEREMTGPLQEVWIERVAQEFGNIRAAMRWWLANGDLQHAAALFWVLRTFLWVRGDLMEVRRWTDALVELSSPADATLHARVTLVAGFTAFEHADLVGGVRLLDEAEAHGRASGQLDVVGTALLLRALFMPADRDLAESRRLLERSATAFRASEEPWGEDFTCFGFGEVALIQHDFAEAERWFDRYLASARQRGDTRTIGQALEALGRLALMRGEPARAVPLVHESIRFCRRVGNVEWLAYCLRDLAGAALSAHEPVRAARLLAAADASWKSNGLSVWPLRRSFYADILERTRSRLGADVFEREWAAGFRYSLDDLLRESPIAATPSASSVDPELAQLTRREREVAGLIARGLTSREIAVLLIISERTADVHADNIRTKLALRSRAEIAAWAAERGLRARSPERE